jgi:hypothetical protein
VKIKSDRILSEQGFVTDWIKTQHGFNGCLSPVSAIKEEEVIGFLQRIATQRATGCLTSFEPRKYPALVKAYKNQSGASLFMMKEDQGNFKFKSNRNYEESNLLVSYNSAETMPWAMHLPKYPLYTHFISNLERFEFLK